MPNIVQGAFQRSLPDFSRENYGYKYPNGMDLKPGSDLHKKIVTEVMNRARDSSTYVQQRFTSWEKIDDTLTAYIPLDVAEQRLKYKDSRKPVSIVIPISYAVMETILTNWVATFLEGPIFKYRGVGPEDILGAILLEKVIDVHCNYTKVPLALHTMMRDALAYGYGVVSPTWIKELGKKTVAKDNSMWSYLKNAFVSMGFSRGVSEEETLFEGNSLVNISPYCFLPDPNVPIHDIQKGEFHGWVERTNRVSLLDREKTSGGEVFNAKYLKHLGGTGYSSVSPTKNEPVRTGYTTPMDVVYMYVNLVPSDEAWKLGSEEYPEKWLFGVAADCIVVMAKPLGLDHNQFPVVTCAPEYDGYGISPISKLEMCYGLQGNIDFLLNNHIANVRKAVNDRIIVDPALINMNDLLKSGEGGIIRLRSSAWGRGIMDQAAKQLEIRDITQSNVADMEVLVDLVTRISSASDVLQGIRRRTGERVSATESRDVKMGGLSRINKMAKVISLMSMNPIARFFAAHAQQLMDEDLFVRTTGRWEETLKEEFGITTKTTKATPLDLLVNYDVEMDEGMGTGGEYADTWVNLYGILTKTPMVASQFDMVRIFKHIARLLGATNISDFVAKGGQVNMSIQPNQQVLDQAQAGNLVPVPTGQEMVG